MISLFIILPLLTIAVLIVTYYIFVFEKNRKYERSFNYQKIVDSSGYTYICKDLDQYYDCITDIIQDFMTQEVKEVRYIRYPGYIFIVSMDSNDLIITQCNPTRKIHRRVLHVQKPLFR